MSVGRESGHVNSNNRKDCFGTIRTNAGNSVNGVYGISILVMHIAVDFIIKRSDMLIQFINVEENNAQHLLLKRRENALQIVQNLLWRCLQISDNQFR